MRLFTGIALPGEISGNLSRLLDYLRPFAHIRWSAPYNLHITMKFIGEWPEERLDELLRALRSLSSLHAMQLALTGLGWLPKAHSPRVLFCGVSPREELAELAARTEDALAPLGVERESRKFTPHLTLGRVRDPATSLAKLRQAIAQLESQEFGSWTADAFHLYLSRTGPAGSIYTQLAEIPLAH